VSNVYCTDYPGIESGSLPVPSRLSVRNGPEGCLRLWRSSRYHHISPLLREFHLPLPPSSGTVSPAVRGLSPRLWPATGATAYTPFTPS